VSLDSARRVLPALSVAAIFTVVTRHYPLNCPIGRNTCRTPLT